MQLSDLDLFLKTAEAGSLVATARETGLATTTVSERLRELEAHYGAALLDQSNEKVMLTAEGEILADGARRLLTDATRLEANIKSGASAGARIIRFSAPTDLGEQVILPIVDKFLESHPGVSIDTVISDENVDILRQGMDFAVRDGRANHEAMTSEYLLHNDRVVVAAPSYIARMGAPEHPQDLIHHQYLTPRVGEHINRFWRFDVGGDKIDAPITPVRTTNNARLIAQWCRAGHGVAIKSRVNVAQHLADGSLVEVLDRYPPPAGAFYLVYPADRTFSPLVAAMARAISDGLEAFQADNLS